MVPHKPTHLADQRHDPGTLLILTTVYRRGVDFSTFADVFDDVLVVDVAVDVSTGRTVTSTRLPT